MTTDVVTAAARIAEKLDLLDPTGTSPAVAPQSLIRGATGIALLHIERARAGLGSWVSAHRWLTAAIHDGADAGPHATMFYGAPALAYTVHGAATPGRYQGALAALDTATTDVTRERLTTANARIDRGTHPPFGEFDLVYGLAGLGAHQLRRDPNGPLVREVLGYLVRLTEPFASGLPGWWTDHGPSGRPDPAFPGGHANFGMAHGIAGPLALLSLAMKRGILVDGQPEAIERICRWLDWWQQRDGTGAWWPEWVTPGELWTGRIHHAAPTRPSWCYGTPGLARAQQLAGQATGDGARQRLAAAALLACLTDPRQLGLITDSGLCHGWAGLILTSLRTAADAPNRELAERVDTLLPRLVDAPATGDPGFLEGAAGLALAMHAAADHRTATAWDTCLLIN